MRRLVGSIFAAALAASALPAAAQWFGVNPPHGSGLDPNTSFDVNLGDRTGGLGQDYGTALAAMRVKHYGTAVRLLGDITDQAPDRMEVWRLLGAAYGGQGRWDRAQRAYERALKLAPNDILSHAGRAQALVARKDPAAAEERAWLQARSQACGGGCPDAQVLKALETHGPFATAS
jgi:tetratricopeptide (TPR) repeat protein